MYYSNGLKNSMLSIVPEEEAESYVENRLSEDGAQSTVEQIKNNVDILQGLAAGVGMYQDEIERYIGEIAEKMNAVAGQIDEAHIADIVAMIYAYETVVREMYGAVTRSYYIKDGKLCFDIQEN